MSQASSSRIHVIYKWTANEGKLAELKAIFKKVLAVMETEEPDTAGSWIYTSEDSVFVHDVFRNVKGLTVHMQMTATHFAAISEIAKMSTTLFLAGQALPQEIVDHVEILQVPAEFAELKYSFSKTAFTAHDGKQVSIVSKLNAKEGKLEELVTVYQGVLASCKEEPLSEAAYLYASKTENAIFVQHFFKDFSGMTHHLQVTTPAHFPKVLAVATPGPFLCLGPITAEDQKMISGMMPAAAFADEVLGSYTSTHFGFDLSYEEYDGPAVQVAEGKWGPTYTVSETHYPGGVAGMPPLNNRGIICTVEDAGVKSLLMCGIPGTSCIPKLKQLEKDTGLELKTIVGSGDQHHMALSAWLTEYPKIHVYQSGIKFPTTKNGSTILANEDFKARITLIDGEPESFAPLAKYSDEIQFFGFNQANIYPEQPWMTTDTVDKKNQTKQSFFGFMKKMASTKATQRFLCVWFYHVPSKTLLTEHNWEIFWTKEAHHKMPFVMKMTQPTEAWESCLHGPIPKGPSDPAAQAKHCQQFAPIKALDVRMALDFHIAAKVYAKAFLSKEHFQQQFLRALEKSGEHDETGAGMAEKCVVM